MFYSNQLLSRKGPFGQIWIAATMHKINRRKAEQIDIAEICEQILNPVVPLALRLSGILMGGVVLIYDRKVRFFSEDVNNLLIQIKLVTAIKGLDTTSLPKEKSQARFEAITIDYGFDEEYNEIERVMLRPSTPDDGETARDEEFFFIPGAPAPEKGKKFEHRFQVEQEKITIQEDHLQPEAVVGDDNDDRIPPPNDMIMDDLCPEFQIQDELPPELNIALDEEAQQSTVQGLKPVKEAEAARSSEGSPQHKKSRTRRKTKKRALVDIDFTEIPAQVFTAWLKEPADIVKDSQARGKRCKLTHDAIVERYFCFPSSSLSWSADSGVESTWAPPLLQLWNLSRATRKSTPSTETDSSELPRQLRRRTLEQADQDFEMQDFQKVDLPQTDISIIEAAEILQDIQEGVEVPKYAEYGSIEKLRSALHTPNTKNQDELLLNQLGLTPRLSGQSGKSTTALKMTTPGSGRLSLDIDVDFPKHAASTRRSRSIGDHLSPGLELLPDDYLKETIATNYDTFGDGGVLGATLSQFVLEETWPSQEPLHPQSNPIDKVTSSILQIMRERFNQHPKGHISADDLTGDLDRSQAAKLFYQICVMASNRFISVDQAKPYGTILIRRGAYL